MVITYISEDSGSPMTGCYIGFFSELTKARKINASAIICQYEKLKFRNVCCPDCFGHETLISFIRELLWTSLQGTGVAQYRSSLPPREFSSRP